MTDQARIEVERHGHIAVLTYHNPPANTWTPDSLGDLAQTIEALQQDASIYGLILTGQGERFFSAGADLNQFSSGDKAQAWQMAMQFERGFDAIRQYRGVTIAMINGYALGGGLEWALACDIRIAEHHALLGLPEASVGLLPCAGGTQQLPRLVGEGWAKRIILCGEKVTAHEAREIGLVEIVTSPGEGLTAALGLGEKIAAQSPTSIAACKRLIAASVDGTPSDLGRGLEREAFIALFEGEDQQEGVKAFLEKRAPRWSNQTSSSNK
uniref:enoyl-CoA hydratase n=1 Tax=Thaumasiovibrio occultus TaxID=1891184 RepID=UPI000B3506A8|nr:enoyl-CoA hydratase [Thaumasiovibrio occultus]